MSFSSAFKNFDALRESFDKRNAALVDLMDVIHDALEFVEKSPSSSEHKQRILDQFAKLESLSSHEAHRVNILESDIHCLQEEYRMQSFQLHQAQEDLEQCMSLFSQQSSLVNDCIKNQIKSI